MPIYEYKCKKCEKVFEYIQKFSDDPRESCENCSGSLVKIVSQSAIKFKGSGWYVNDYGKPRTREARGTVVDDNTDSSSNNTEKTPSEKKESTVSESSK